MIPVKSALLGPFMKGSPTLRTAAGSPEARSHLL